MSFILTKKALKNEINKINDYKGLFYDINILYTEETYIDGEDELYIVLNGFKYHDTLIYYLTDRINDYLGHDAVIIENYGELVSFNLNRHEKNEFKNLEGLLKFFYEKIDISDLINLLNNNACFIQIYDAKKSEWVYFKKLYDVEGYNKLVNKAINSENTIYYEDESYKINKGFKFKELDYL